MTIFISHIIFKEELHLRYQIFIIFERKYLNCKLFQFKVFIFRKVLIRGPNGGICKNTHA
jgi:hypothetical protein